VGAKKSTFGFLAEGEIGKGNARTKRSNRPKKNKKKKKYRWSGLITGGRTHYAGID